MKKNIIDDGLNFGGGKHIPEKPKNVRKNKKEAKNGKQDKAKNQKEKPQSIPENLENSENLKNPENILAAINKKEEEDLADIDNKLIQDQEAEKTEEPLTGPAVIEAEKIDEEKKVVASTGKVKIKKSADTLRRNILAEEDKVLGDIKTEWENQKNIAAEEEEDLDSGLDNLNLDEVSLNNSNKTDNEIEAGDAELEPTKESEKTWFVSKIAMDGEDSPHERALLRVLGNKISEYENKLGTQMDAGDSEAYDSFYRAEILRRVLRDGQVNIAELAEDIRSAQGGLNEQKFNEACEIINDYVNNDGLGVGGGFRFDLAEALADEKRKENQYGQYDDNLDKDKDKDNEADSEPSLDQEPIIDDNQESKDSDKDYFFQMKWEALTPAQQKFVKDGLTQFYIEEAKEKARENFAKETGKGAGFFKGIWRNATKGIRLARMEKDYLQYSLIDPEDNAVYAEHLMEIAQRMGQEMVEKDGKIFINYDTNRDLSAENRQLFEQFNTAANNFGSLPQEWAFDSASKGKQESFKKEKSAYEFQRMGLLYALIKEKGEAEALDLMNNIDSQVALRQFLTSNPDAAKEFKNMKDGAPWKRMFGTVLAERGAMTAAGAVTRGGLRGAKFFGLVGAGVSTVALPVIAATLGAWRGFVRADKKFKEGDIQGRHQEVEDSLLSLRRNEYLHELQQLVPAEYSLNPKEWLQKYASEEEVERYNDYKKCFDKANAEFEKKELGISRNSEGKIKGVKHLEANISQADDLTDKLVNSLNRINALSLGDFKDYQTYKNEVDRLRASLQARIDFSRDKLNRGLVGFGSGPERSAKFLSLQQAIAIAEVNSLESEKSNEISQKTAEFLDYLQGRTSKQRLVQKSISAVKGAVLSTGFFYAGAYVREAVQNAAHHLYENVVDYFSPDYNHDVTADVLTVGATNQFPGSHLADTTVSQQAPVPGPLGGNLQNASPTVESGDLPSNTNVPESGTGDRVVNEAKETIKSPKLGRARSVMPKVKVGAAPDNHVVPQDKIVDKATDGFDDLPKESSANYLDDTQEDEAGLLKKIPGMNGNSTNAAIDQINRSMPTPKGTMVGVPEDETFNNLPKTSAAENLSSDLEEEVNKIPSLDGRTVSAGLPLNSRVDSLVDVNSGATDAEFNPDEATPVDLKGGASVFNNQPATNITPEDLPASSQVDNLENINNEDLPGIPSNDNAGLSGNSSFEDLPANSSTEFNPDEASPVNLKGGTSVFENHSQPLINTEDLPVNSNPSNLEELIQDGEGLPNIPAASEAAGAVNNIQETILPASSNVGGLHEELPASNQTIPYEGGSSGDDDWLQDNQDILDNAGPKDFGGNDAIKEAAEAASLPDNDHEVAKNISNSIVDGVYNNKRGFLTAGSFMKKFEELNKEFKISAKDKLAVKNVWEEIQKDKTKILPSSRKVIGAKIAALEKSIIERSNKI